MAGDERQGGGDKGSSERQVTNSSAVNKGKYRQTLGFGQKLAPGTSVQFPKNARDTRLHRFDEGVGGRETPDSEILLPAEP